MRLTNTQIVLGTIALVLVTILATAGIYRVMNASDGTDVAGGDNATLALNTAQPLAGPPVANPDRVTGDRLAAAFSAVFGRASPIRTDIDGQAGSLKALRVIDTSFGPVLLTESTIPDGCHACVGYVGAFYLREVGGKFEVTGKYPNAAPGSGWGAPPDGWTLVDRFTANPALYYEGGYTGQGYTELSGSIVELTPKGPVHSVFARGSDNSGAAMNDADIFSTEGKIANVVKDKSFDVVFTGSCKYTQRYTKQGGKFEPQGDASTECQAAGGM